jgi:hypothetical protein
MVLYLHEHSRFYNAEAICDHRLLFGISLMHEVSSMLRHGGKQYNICQWEYVVIRLFLEVSNLIIFSHCLYREEYETVTGRLH